jgi:hypothetical protein
LSFIYRRIKCMKGKLKIFSPEEQTLNKRKMLKWKRR